jgi:hypothetical protein
MRPQPNSYESDYIQDCRIVDREFDRFEMEEVIGASLHEVEIAEFLHDTFDL